MQHGRRGIDGSISANFSDHADHRTIIAVFVLDPSDAPKTADQYQGASAHIPKHVQGFGFVPNPDDLKLGDAVLCSPRVPEWHQSQIRTIQSNTLRYITDDIEQHAQWTHVAMSVEGWDVAEAVVPKISRNSMLKSYVPGYGLRARRVPEWTDEERSQFSAKLMKSLGERYDRWTAAKIWLADKASWFFNAPLPSREKNAKICSTLYADTYMDSTAGGSLWPGENLEMVRVPLPADISRSPRLKDIPWGWLRL